jgi:transmembrane sensor
MKKREAETLILRYMGNCTPDERRLVETYFMDYLQSSEELPLPDQIEVHQKEMWSSLEAYISPHQMITPNGRAGISRRYRNAMGIWIAAAAIAMVIFGIWLFSYRTRSGHPEESSGSNIAFLALDNGKRIRLSDAKRGVTIGRSGFVYNDGTPVAGAAERGLPTKTIAASTPRGRQYQINLPDGTKVWLNAATLLKFPQSFDNVVNRVVELSGEAYFEVAKDKAHPFIVKTALQQVEVLGTHFNISSYADEPSAKTSVLEGSVKISSLSGERKAIVKAGEQTIMDKTFTVKLQKVLDLEYVVAWRAMGDDGVGYLVFHNDSLEEVMRRISRWYNVRVVIKGNVKKDFRLSGKVQKNKTLSEILHVIELTGIIQFKVEGTKVTVYAANNI